MKLLAIIACTGLLAFCQKAGGHVMIKSSSTCLKIPEEYLAAASFLDGIDFGDTDDGYPEIRLRVSKRDLLNSVKNPQTIKTMRLNDDDDFNLLLALLTEENIEYILSNIHYEDMWRGTGQYEENELGRTVELFEGSNVFKVAYRDISYSWVLTDLDPRSIEGKLPPYKNFVASCRSIKNHEVLRYSCTRSFLLDGGIKVNYRLKNADIFAYEEVDKFLTEKVESWKISNPENCK